MSNGKYARQPQRRRRTHKKKASLLLTSLILLLTLIVGGTVSFLVASSGQVQNTFTPSKVACRVDEDSFGGSTKTNVKVTNTGDTTAYIRAAIVVTWKDAQGNVYPKTPTLGTDYTMTLNTSDWFQKDGFYYYKSPVAKDNSTGVLITSCSPVEGKTPEGYGLNVEILGSAIQSVPTNVVTSIWSVTLDGNGNITG